MRREYCYKSKISQFFSRVILQILIENTAREDLCNFIDNWDKLDEYENLLCDLLFDWSFWFCWWSYCYQLSHQSNLRCCVAISQEVNKCLLRLWWSDSRYTYHIISLVNTRLSFSFFVCFPFLKLVLEKKDRYYYWTYHKVWIWNDIIFQELHWRTYLQKQNLPVCLFV